MLCVSALGLDVLGAKNIVNAAEQEGAAVLEELVVTARRREENLQDVPIAVTAFQGDRLEQMDISDVSAFGDLAPNVTLKPTASLSGASNAAAFFIRGVGQTDFAVTTDPGVGTYLDGVYIARSVGGVLDTLDIESVEVLRGPQGTLFGRNTIGGAINIRSRRPADELSGDIRASTPSFYIHLMLKSFLMIIQQSIEKVNHEEKIYCQFVSTRASRFNRPRS